MTEKLCAVYARKDEYRGHSRINHYHWTVRLECYAVSLADERRDNILINGAVPQDYFSIMTLNYKGEVTWRHKFETRDEANAFIRKALNCGFKLVRKE